MAFDLPIGLGNPKQGGIVNVHDHDVRPEEIGPSGTGMSRRQFLRLASLAGAAVAVGGGLSGVLAACGGNTATTTVPSATTTTVSAGASTSAASTAGKIKIGLITDFSIPQLVNNQRVFEALVEGANKRGGWDAGAPSMHWSSFHSTGSPRQRQVARRCSASSLRTK